MPNFSDGSIGKDEQIVRSLQCGVAVTVTHEIKFKFKSGLNETIFGSYEIFPKQKPVYPRRVSARTRC